MKEILDKIEAEVIEIRRTLHKYPELGFEENKTSALVADYLKNLGIETTTGIAKTGVMGLIRGGEGKTLLIRADMDALPMDESGTSDYSSRNKGVMHACGHDVHTAILLGVANVLSKQREHINGNVKLIFQPAEESMGGALPMIEEGIMESPRVDAAAAYHIWNLPAGTIGIREGGVTASPDHFQIRVTGRGGHGATPENCVNPLEIAAEITTKLSGISLDAPSVVSICGIIGGTSENIIPDSCLVMGTARALDSVTRQRLYEMIVSICNKTAESFGGFAAVDYRFLYPPGINDGGMVELFTQAAKSVIGSENIIYQQKPDMIGDDFAYFSELVPSCYVKLGGATAPLHTSGFDVDESCIKTGISVMCRFALDFLK